MHTLTVAVKHMPAKTHYRGAGNRLFPCTCRTHQRSNCHKNQYVHDLVHVNLLVRDHQIKSGMRITQNRTAREPCPHVHPFMQARCEASEAEVQHLQQRLHTASSDRTAELEHTQQLNKALKGEIAAMQHRLTGMSGPFNGLQENNIDSQSLQSFGSCLLEEPGSGVGQPLPQLSGSSNQYGMLQPYPAAHRLAPIPEGDGSISNHTSMHGDEALQDVHLVPELQSQVRALAVSLQDKMQEAEALQVMVDQFRNEVCCPAYA